MTEMLGVEHPIVGFNRSPAVVAEVSKAGGFGVLAATAYKPAELDAQLTWIERQIGDRPYGVDLLVPGKAAKGDPDDLVASLRAQIPGEHLEFVEDLLERYGIPPLPAQAPSSGDGVNIDASLVPQLLDVAFAHRISLVANALGTPPPDLSRRGKENGVLVAGLVGKREHAERQLAAGVDLLVAQGTEAGGHTGTIATTVLTPEIVDAAGDVPVLAAGGMSSGRQIAAALALGAAGAWCGSVWLSTHEDIAPRAVKEKFLAAGSGDTLRSPVRTGKPARQLHSAWHDEWTRPGSPDPLPMPLQPMLTLHAWDRIDAAAEQGHEGAKELESFYIGQVVGFFAELRGAGELTRELAAGCRARIAELAGLAEPGEFADSPSRDR